MTWQTNPIDGHTRLVGLIGWPLGPYSSLTIHNAAFDAVGLNWRHVPLRVSKGRLPEALRGLWAMGFAGAEVMEPYQRDVLNHLEIVSSAAETIGVVNFVQINDSGRLAGDNTRWLGFLALLRTLVPSLNGLRALVIGAGDTARSVVYALTREGLPMTIIDERMDRAIDLVRRLRHVLDEHSFSVHRWPHDLERVARNADLIINATPIGMWPDVDRSPWLDDLPFPPGALVFDLASCANDTRFLRQARVNGVKTVSGMSLSIYEAAIAFEKWTRQSPPAEVMWRVAEGGAMPGWALASGGVVATRIT